MTLSVAQRVAELQPAARAKLLAGLDDQQIEQLLFDWRFWARPEQLLPPGGWDVWLVMTGRGWGKTRTGAEAVRQWDTEGYRRFHLVGRTAGDVRDVMIEGESGMLSVYPGWQRPRYEPSKKRLTLASGAVCELFSADEPDSLRGPQCQKAWVDEPATWRYGVETWDNLVLGLRLGDRPQCVATTTPRPVVLVKRLAADSGTVVQGGSLVDNADNLAPSFARRILERYQGTRLGRQEIEGLLLEDTPGALWKRAWIDETRWTWERWEAAVKKRVVVAVDPSVSEGPTSNEAGVVCAAEVDGREYAVVADRSGVMGALAWATAAVELYQQYTADSIVAEANQGGDLVLEMLKQVCEKRGLPLPRIRLVHAKRGKILRAQPVAALYEQRRVHHVGPEGFPELEDQQANFDPDEMPGLDDRTDALVYALIEISGVAPLDGPMMV